MSFWLSLSSAGADLVINVSGFKNQRGLVQVALWNQSQGFPENYEAAYDLLTVNFSELSNIQFRGIPAGNYGVAIYHDENSDYELNTSIFGRPKEGFAFSNDPKITFGPPKFEEVVFKLEGVKEKVINLRVRYP